MTKLYISSLFVHTFYVNSIWVGTQSWSTYVNWFYVNILAAIESERELSAIFDSDSFNCEIITHNWTVTWLPHFSTVCY